MANQDPKTGRFLPGNKAGADTRFQKGNIEQSRDVFHMTRAQKRAVINALTLGMTVEEACELVINPNTGKPIDKKTLYRRMGGKVKEAVHKRTMELLETAHNRAMDNENKDQGNMLRFLIRLRGKHDQPPKESPKVEVNNSGEGPVVLVIGQTGEDIPELEDLQREEDDWIDGELE